MTGISLEQANAIVQNALSKGAELKLQPLTITVLDAGGHAIALARQDGASTLRPQIAHGKAATALALGVNSRKVGEMAQDRPTFIAALGSLAPDGIVPAAGGVLVVNDTGQVIGAVGITGDTSDQDETCALAGIAAAGLKALG